MAYKVYNSKTRKYALAPGSDASGAFITKENGVKEYALTVAVTHNVTTTAAAAGSFAMTSHATGRGKIFYSDGAKWQSVTGS